MREVSGLLGPESDTTLRGSGGGARTAFRTRTVGSPRRERELERQGLVLLRLSDSERGQVECWQPRFLPKPLCFSFAYGAGVLLIEPLRHPPSIRPISSSWPASGMYLSLCIRRPSQASWRKNFSKSVLAIALPSTGIFCSVERYAEAKVSSSTSRKSDSMRAPMPRRSTRGKSL